jgi:hypothetical protein
MASDIARWVIVKWPNAMRGADRSSFLCHLRVQRIWLKKNVERRLTTQRFRNDPNGCQIGIKWAMTFLFDLRVQRIWLKKNVERRLTTQRFRSDPNGCQIVIKWPSFAIYGFNAFDSKRTSSEGWQPRDFVAIPTDVKLALNENFGSESFGPCRLTVCLVPHDTSSS